VPKYLSDVIDDFTSVWLPELLFALIPYVVLRALTIGRLIRSSWWSFCVAGVVTYPFLSLYTNLLLRDWNAPSIYNIGAHIICVVSAILTELFALALFSTLRRLGRIAEQNAEPELPITGF